MPDIKISALPQIANTPTSFDQFAIVQNNITYRTTVGSLSDALVDNLSTGAPTWDGDGNLTAGYDIIAGGNHDGRVALTINDGYGNANLTFNHTNGVPDRSGSSARITVNVDSADERMDFQLKGSVSADSNPVSLITVLRLYDDNIQLLKKTSLSVNGTANTSLVNKGYIDSALSTKSNTNHTHTNYATVAHNHDLAYAPFSHTHTIAQVNGLQAGLDDKISLTQTDDEDFSFSGSGLVLNKIGTTKIKDNAITEELIGDGEVTPAKLSIGHPSWDTTGKVTINNDLSVAGGITISGIVDEPAILIKDAQSDAPGREGEIAVPIGEWFSMGHWDATKPSASRFIPALWFNDTRKIITSSDLDVLGTKVIVKGGDGGDIALTLNDGHGNANVAFNHTAGIPDREGGAGRISVWTDYQDLATNGQMEFSVANNVSAETEVSLTTLLSLRPDGNVAILPQRDLRFGGIDTANSHGRIVRYSGTGGALDIINTGSGNTNFYNATNTLKMKLKGGSNGHIALYGGSETEGANIEIYGGQTQTHANKIYYDATVHTFRLQNAVGTGVTIDSTGLRSTQAPANDDNVITKKYLIDNTSNILKFFTAATSRPVGWYTIAYSYGRAIARFGIKDAQSGSHQSTIFTASSTYGEDDGHNISVQHHSYYDGSGTAGPTATKIRIVGGGTYDGSLLQVYVNDTTNILTVHLLGDNFQNTSSNYQGWVLTPWTPDGTRPTGFIDSISPARAFARLGLPAASQINLDKKNGGLFTTDEIYAGGTTAQYRVLHEGAGGTLAGDGLTITGHSSPSLSGAGTAKFAYANDATNLWLKGNSAGVSGIFFESSKNGTNVNTTSDGAFIQYRAHGIGNTTGEKSDLVIGITNDASAASVDKIVFNTPGKDQLVITYDAGATEKKIYHEGNLPNFLRADADDTFSGNLVSSGRNKSICGNYSIAKIDQIWAISTGYKIDSNGANFGNLYGLAHRNTNTNGNTEGGIKGGGNEILWCDNGNPRGAIGYNRVWHAQEVKAPTGQFDVVNATTVNATTVNAATGTFTTVNTNTVCGNDTNNALILRADPTSVDNDNTASIYLASKYDPGEDTGTFNFPQIFHKADYHTFSANTAHVNNPNNEPVAVIPPTVYPFADNHLVRKDYVDNVGYPAYKAFVPQSSKSGGFVFIDPSTRVLYPPNVTFAGRTLGYTIGNGTWTGSGGSNDLYVRASIQFFNAAGEALSIKYEDTVTRYINTSNGQGQTRAGAIVIPEFTLYNSDWDNIFMRVVGRKMGGTANAFNAFTLGFFDTLNNTRG